MSLINLDYGKKVIQSASLIRDGMINIRESNQSVNLWSLGDAITDGPLSSTYAVIAVEDTSKLEVGATYRVEFNYDITFGSLQLLVGNNGPISTVGSGNTIAEVKAYNTDFFRVRQTTANTIGSLTNISVTKV